MGMSATKHVLYLALQPPPEVAAEAVALAEDLRRELRMPGKVTAASRLHVSLNNIGEFKHPPASVIAKVMAGLAHVAARPFVVEFNRVGAWGRGDAQPKTILWGEDGVIGVNELYSTLHKALGRIDFAPRREAPVEPHMTLIHGGVDMAERFVEPIRWQAREAVLIHAAHGAGHFEIAGRVPLSA